MLEPTGSRVVVKDAISDQIRTKSTAEIVKENDILAKRLAASRTSQLLKEAIRRNDFSAVVPKLIDTEQSIMPSNMVDAKADGGYEMADSVSGKRYFSLNFGVVGSGQAGGRIAEVFSKYGYSSCIINTAQQDMQFVEMDEDRKYLIDNKDLGGTGKDLDISAQCFEEREGEIKKFVSDKVGDCEAFVLAVSGGGGTGSGGAELLASWLSEFGKPVVAIYILPGSFDDSQAKFNAITTLDRLSDLVSREVISSLVLVDNANIEMAFPNLSQAAFFKTANRAVVEPLHMFNSVSVMPTEFESLDPMDFSRLLLEHAGCAVFGTNAVSKDLYESSETAIMEAVIQSLDQGLLASGFDLKEAQSVGVLITAKQSVLESIPYSNIAYMFKYITDEYASARTFKGVYAVPSDNEDVTVRFIFSGLGLPKSRIDSMKEDAKKHKLVLEDKKKQTNIAVGLHKNRAESEINRNIAKIKKMKTGFGKLLNNGGNKIERKR